ncbi:hypothetical protein [Planktomarina sp.]|jgi:hypothetical protein|uniref:hypothetical protein n=1 Tax=Planktomarina sp. TaxID=2024851 RepID=UPI003261568F
MKVVQGEFGKTKEAIKASDLFQSLADAVDEMEEGGIDVKTAIVIFSDSKVMQVVSNDSYPDSAHMLLQMGAQSIMLETLGYGGEE